MAVGSKDYAWLLELTIGGTTHRFSTTDPDSEADITALGNLYRARIRNEIVVRRQLNDMGAGVNLAEPLTIELVNDFDARLPDDLACWLRADRLAGLSDNDPLTTYTDFSGNGFDFAGVSTARPAFNSDAAALRNGLPVVTFDAVNDGMSSALSLALPCTLFAVYSCSAAAGNRRAVQSSTTNFLMGPYNSGGNKIQAFTNGAFVTGPVLTSGQLYVQALVLTAANAWNYVDGTLYGTKGSAAAAPGTITLGAVGSFAEPLGGDFVEFLALRREPSPIEVARISAIIARRWATTTAVPLEGLDPAIDYRLASATLSWYDRNTNTKTVEMLATVTGQSFPGKVARLTIRPYATSALTKQIPSITVNPTGAFATAYDAGAAIPAVMGLRVPVRPPHVADDTATTNPPGHDYLVSHGAAGVAAAYRDVNRDRAGLESLAQFVTAPGSPVYVSSSRFSVTGNQKERFHVVGGGTPTGGMPVRFQTNNDGIWLYTSVHEYDETASPDQVVLEDAILPSNFTDMQIGSDVLVHYGYAGYTAVRTYAPVDGAFIVLASQPLGTGGIDVRNPAGAISEILSNTDWGLGDSYDPVSFLTALADFAAAGLSPAIDGAVGYDHRQRDAGNLLLDELLPMRGGRLGQTTGGLWTLEVSKAPVAGVVATFELGVGLKNNIDSVDAYDPQPVENAVRNVVVRFAPVGRTQGGGNFQNLSENEFSRTATMSVTGKGKDVVLSLTMVRLDEPAGRVAYFVGKRLKHGDRPLIITVPTPEVVEQNVGPGSPVRVVIPELGVDARFTVMGILGKRLEKTQLRLFYDPDEVYTYDAAQVVITDELAEVDLQDTPPGPNLLENPDFSAPIVEILPYESGPTMYAPHGWITTRNNDATKATWRGVDRDRAILSSLESGHYIEFENLVTWQSGFYSGKLSTDAPIPMEPNTRYFAAIRCDRTEHVRAIVWIYQEGIYSALGVDDLISYEDLKLTYDATDTNARGWGRFYGQFSTTDPDVTRAQIMWLYVGSGIVRWEAPLVQKAGALQLKPSKWTRDRASAAWVDRVVDVTLTPGTGTVNVTGLILSGEECKGIYTEVITTVTLGGGGATVSLGLDIAEGCWIEAIPVAQLTAGKKFAEEKWKAAPTIFPTGAIVRAVTNAGTFTTGVLRLTAKVRRETSAGDV